MKQEQPFFAAKAPQTSPDNLQADLRTNKDRVGEEATTTNHHTDVTASLKEEGERR